MSDLDRLAFKNLFEVVAWLAAATCVLYTLHYTMTRQFTDVGPGMHPASFLLFIGAFIALNLRYFRLAPQSVRAIAPGLSRALLAVLCIVIMLRVVEDVAGVPFPVLSFLFGDQFSGGAYTSWGTATGILLLFAMATLIPDQPRPGLFWVSYAAYWLVVTLCVHQILHWSGMGTSGLVPLGVASQSAISLLCLAGVALPRSPYWPALFDTRTPLSNTTVVGVMLLALGVVLAEALMMKHLGPLEPLAFALLLSLPVLARYLRGKEIATLIAEGALTKAGKLRPLKTVPDMRPLPEVQRSFWVQLIFDYAFVKPVWVQDALHAIVTAALASASIMFSSLDEESFATLWPVNGFLCYWLITNPVSRWPQVLGYFYVTLLGVNLTAGSTLQMSAMLVGLNAVEGLTLALLIRQIMGLSVQNRRVQIETLAAPKVWYSIFACLIALAGTSVVGGAVFTYAFGGDMLPNAWVWYFASATGSAMIGPIALGYLMAVHWGFPPLQSVVHRPLLILLTSWIAFWTVLPFAAQFALGIPLITYVLFSSLGMLFSSLGSAALHFTVVTVLLLTFRKLYPDALVLIPPTFLAVQILLMSIIVGAFVDRKQQERARRELDLISAEGPSNVVTLDHTGAIITCTENLTRVTATDKSALIGHNLLDVLQVEATDDTRPRVPTLGIKRWRVNIPRSSVRAVDIVTKSVTDQTMPFAFICAVRDQTEALKAEEVRITQIERSTALIVTQDVAWRVVQCSDGWCDTMGYTREETVGRDLHDFLVENTQRKTAKKERGRDPYDRAMATNSKLKTRYKFREKSGGIRILVMHSVLTGGNTDVVTTTLQDVTSEVSEREKKERAYAQLKAQSLILERGLEEQKRLEKTAKTYLDVSASLFIIQNEDFQITQMSKPLLEMLGYQCLSDLPEITRLRADGVESVLQRRPKILATPIGVAIEPYRMSFWTNSGERRDFQLRCKWISSLDGKSRILASNLEDVTHLQKQADVLQRQAETDPMTGVLNRLGLQRRLNDVRSPSRQQDLVICLVDVDWFKSVNDTYSHHVGDEMLKAIAKTLQPTLFTGLTAGGPRRA